MRLEYADVDWLESEVSDGKDTMQIMREREVQMLRGTDLNDIHSRSPRY
jgi:hypothetical protein